MSEVVKNPHRPLELAVQCIAELAKTLQDARDALWAPPLMGWFDSGLPPTMPNFIMVDEAEYNRLRACAAIVRQAAP